MAHTIKPVFIDTPGVVSALGSTLQEHWDAIVNKASGIKPQHITGVNEPFFCSQPIEDFTVANGFTPFENLALEACKLALQGKAITPNTVFILSTTKGNIELLGTIPDEEINLSNTARKLALAVGIKREPIVVSQACISGVVALQYAQWLLQDNDVDQVLVCGADRLSSFVQKGFQSFQAIAQEACMPFDAERKGINLGEAAAALWVTKNKTENSKATLLSACTSNDANHISGPSRTGEELAIAIRQVLRSAHLSAQDISMISSHGTATPYNDEMEAKALYLCGLQEVPTHSFKSFIGHTLGAAGIIETAICMEAMQRQTLIPSLRYQKHGVSVPLNICTAPKGTPINYVLKTASGFGGTNGALIIGNV